MQKIVIINRGIPASGKSTFAKEIKQKLTNSYDIKVVVCSTDDYFIKDEKYVFDRDKLRKYHLKNQQKFQEALDDETDIVICDNTNIEPWETQPYYYMAKIKNYRVLLMDFEPRELKSHIDAQTDKGYNHNIPEDILKNMYKRYIDFKELTDKHSYPKPIHKKKVFNEKLNKTEQTDELSEPFYYDELIKIPSNEQIKILKIIPDMIYKKMKQFSFDDISLIRKEYKIIMQMFEEKENKTLTAYEVKKRINKSAKQTERYLKDLVDEFKNIIPVKDGRKNAFKLVDSYDLFVEAFKYSEDLDYLFELAKDKNPELFEKLQYKLYKEKSIFLYKSSIFETIENKELFKQLKEAIKNKEYKNISFKYEEDVKDAKLLKLVFIDNNWYLAYVDDKDILKLARVSFIQKITTSFKNTFKEISVKKQKNFLKDKLQNSMTLYDKQPQTAILQATGSISKYFEKDMKKFFPTQYFLNKEKDGSVIFQVDYTQPMEILPFIQKWMPDLLILEPKSLKDEYLKKLNLAIKNIHGSN